MEDLSYMLKEKEIKKGVSFLTGIIFGFTITGLLFAIFTIVWFFWGYLVSVNNDIEKYKECSTYVSSIKKLKLKLPNSINDYEKVMNKFLKHNCDKYFSNF